MNSEIEMIVNEQFDEFYTSRGRISRTEICDVINGLYYIFPEDERWSVRQMATSFGLRQIGATGRFTATTFFAIRGNDAANIITTHYKLTPTPSIVSVAAALGIRR